MTTDVAPDPYAICRRFVDRVLRTGGSIYNARRIWASERLAALIAALDVAIAAEDASFQERWQAMVTTVDPDVRQLAGEALHLHLVFPSDINGEAKRRLVHDTLAGSPTSPRVPRWMFDALDRGIAPSGVVFKTRRLSQVRFLAAAVAAWRELPAADRDRGLADPVAFRSWLWTVPVAGAHAQREVLLHLVHPDAFEPVVSRAAKRRIAAAWAEHAGDPTDPDLALARIQAALRPSDDTRFSFLSDEARSVWLARQEREPRA